MEKKLLKLIKIINMLRETILDIIIILFLFASFPCNAAERSYIITNWDGLSNANPTCFYQDNDGLLWIGTWDGLNVYDGNNFKIYKHDPNDSNSLSDNVIWRITGNGEGVVWVATDYGINRIDVEANIINRYYLGYDNVQPSRRDAFSVSRSKSGIVFCSANGSGVAYYDSSTDKMILLDSTGINLTQVRDLHCVGNNRLLVILDDGRTYYLKFHIAEGVPVVDGTEEFMSNIKIINSIDHEKIFLVSNDKKLWEIDKLSGEINEKAMLPESGYVSSVEELSDGSIIVAYKSFNVYRIKDQVTKFGPLDGNNVTSLYSGAQGILWAAIDDKGVKAIYHDDVNIDRTLNKELYGKESGQISKIVEDIKGNIYVASQGNGICCIMKDGEKRIISTRSGLRSNKVTSLALGSMNLLYVGEDIGIDIINLDSWRISPLYCDSGNDALSYALLHDDLRDCLWVGTFGNGLSKLHITSINDKYKVDEEEHFLYNEVDSTSINNNTVMNLTWQDKDHLWIGTLGGGLDLLDINESKFKHFSHSDSENSLSSNNVLCMLRESDSSFWVGTTYRLNKITISSADGIVFKSYGTDQGFADNTIHGILKDREGKLWLSTNKGLSSFNVISGEVYIFSGKHYLQNMEFSNGSCLLASDGRMFFGGVDGINAFYPETIKLSSYEPSIHFDRFLVRQKPLSNFVGNRTIRLRHNENFFTVSFSAIDFMNNENCEYSYKLEGFDKEWINNGKNRNAVFTNVPSGKYTLKVISTNGDGVKNDRAPVSLSIIILRPWWNTIWAYAFYFMALYITSYSIFNAFKKKRNKQKMKEHADLERKHKEETYEAKLSFFTNITHEFGTPLTLITGACDQLSSKFKTNDSVKYTGIIKDNVDRMRRLISELLEFRKVDTGNYAPTYSWFDIKAMLSEILGNFSELQEEQGIDLKVSLPEKPLLILSDRNSIEKVIYNLLSNAFKYTPLYGDIEVSLFDDGKTNLIVRNSGHGIASDKIDLIFNRFVILDKMENQAKKGRIFRNGLGLALTKNLVEMLSGKISVHSIIDQYTEFCVCLPHMDPNQVEINEDERTSVVSLMPETSLSTSVHVENRFSGNRNGEKIMIVDDEYEIRKLVAEILGEDYYILQARDGVEALQMLKQERPSLIITDISMPNMDGVTLIRKIKSDEFTKYIPTVILTFNADEDNQIRGYELGIDAFIGKPFHPKHLKAVVKSILGNLSLMQHFYNSAISNKDVYMERVVNTEDRQFMIHLTKLVEQHIDDVDFTLDSLSSDMGISKIGLYRKIKDLSRVSPTIFIRNIRLEKAAHLLNTTNKTALEIMYLCGFNNRAYFYREFQKKYGMSPKKFRADSQNNS